MKLRNYLPLLIPLVAIVFVPIRLSIKCGQSGLEFRKGGLLSYWIRKDRIRKND